MRAAQGDKLEVQQEKSGLDYRKNFLTMRHKEIFTRCLLGGCRRENKISPPLWGLLWSRGLNWAILLSFHQSWEFTINFREGLTFLVEEFILSKKFGCMTPYELHPFDYKLIYTITVPHTWGPEMWEMKIPPSYASPLGPKIPLSTFLCLRTSLTLPELASF